MAIGLIVRTLGETEWVQPGSGAGGFVGGGGLLGNVNVLDGALVP